MQDGCGVSSRPRPCPRPRAGRSARRRAHRPHRLQVGVSPGRAGSSEGRPWEEQHGQEASGVARLRPPRLSLCGQPPPSRGHGHPALSLTVPSSCP